ncbi:MAG TPA: TlpA disulfide reductase family protein [Candidatus Eisenbacteria bacterium]
MAGLRHVAIGRFLSPRLIAPLAIALLAACNLFLLYDNTKLQAKMRHGMALADLAQAPDFSLEQLGSLRNLSVNDFRGQEGTLLFFDPECGACQSEAENWNSLARMATAKGRFFLAICTGSRDGAEAFYKRHALTFPVALDPNRSVLDRYNVPGTPFMYVIDKEGRVGYERTATEANCLRLGFTR